MNSRPAMTPSESISVPSVLIKMIGNFFGKDGDCGANAREKMRASLGVAFEPCRARAS